MCTDVGMGFFKLHYSTSGGISTHLHTVQVVASTVCVLGIGDSKAGDRRQTLLMHREHTEAK